MKPQTRIVLSSIIYLILSGIQSLYSQAVAINTDDSAPHTSAILDIKSYERGLLIPRMTSAQRLLITSPAEGLVVYDETTDGFWFYNGAAWEEVLADKLSLLSDADSDTKVMVEKNPDEDIIRFDLGGSESMILRKNSMGVVCLELVDSKNSTAVGKDALSSNTTGEFNAVLGRQALNANTTGSSNTAIGNTALKSNTTGNNNTAVGHEALYLNTSGQWNTGTGIFALRSNTTGTSNVAAGAHALFNNTIGNENTAIGIQALYQNTSGNFNTGIGSLALTTNTTGTRNVAQGYRALFSNTT